jgi:hypothetical protein
MGEAQVAYKKTRPLCSRRRGVPSWERSKTYGGTPLDSSLNPQHQEWGCRKILLSNILLHDPPERDAGQKVRFPLVGQEDAQTT